MNSRRYGAWKGLPRACNLAIDAAQKDNPLFVGDPGVGKTAIVEGMAARIEAGEVAPALRGVEIYALDMGSLMAGTPRPGSAQAKVPR